MAPKYGTDTFNTALATIELRRRERHAELQPLRADINRYIPHILMDDVTGQPVVQEPIHMLFQNFVKAAWESRKRALVELPFGTGKTAQTLPIITHILGNNRNARIILSSDVHTSAKQRVKAVERILLSAENKDVFSGIEPDTRRGWSADEGLYLVRDSNAVDPSVRPVGALGAGTGPRADVLICDDVVTLDNSVIQNRQAVLRDKVTTVLMSRVIDGGNMLFIGTPYTKSDLYEYLKDNPMFVYLRCPVATDYSCLEIDHNLAGFKAPKTVPLPSYAGPAFMEMRHAEVGNIAWQRGYRLAPVSSDHSWYESLDQAMVLDDPPPYGKQWHAPCITIQGIDLAGKSRKGTSIVTLQVSPNEMRVVDAHYFAGGWEKRKSEILRYGRLWDVDYQIVEANFQQQELIDVLRPKPGETPITWSILSHQTTSNKWDPATGVQAMDIAFAAQEIKIYVGKEDKHLRRENVHAQLRGICRLVEELRMAPAFGTIKVDGENEPTELDGVMALWFAWRFQRNSLGTVTQRPALDSNRKTTTMPTHKVRNAY